MASPTRWVVRARTRSGSVGAVVAVGEQVADPDDRSGRREKAVGPHPLVVVELRDVRAAAVGEQHDHDRIRAGAGRGQLGGHLERGDEGRPARLAGQDPLLAGEPTSGSECVAVAHPDPTIDGRRVVRAGQEVLADALREVGASGVTRQHAALRIRADHDDVGSLRLEVAGRAGDGAAGPDAGDEMGHSPVGLVPDLGAGRPLVGVRVLLVPVLVGLEGAGDVAGESGGHRVVALRRFRGDVGRAEDDLGSVGAKELLLLGRLLVGHDEDAAVTLQGGRDGEAVAGVAARRLDDRAARLEQARPFGRLDHRQPDAVLHRAARVEHLELGQDEGLASRRPEIAGDPAQADEGRIPDEVDDRLGVLHPAEDTPGRSGRG